MRSRGIELRLEPSALGLPLAPHPEASRERARYRERRENALAKVKDNLGDVLDGSHWDQVRALLPAAGPAPAANRLLDRIEALDGGELAQIGFREFLRAMLAEGRPGAFDCSGWPEKQYPKIKTCGPQSAGLKLANDWGFRDILGNVWEWMGDQMGFDRVIRGGSWRTLARGVRAASRGWGHPGDRSDGLGFRLARGQGLRSGR